MPDLKRIFSQVSDAGMKVLLLYAEIPRIEDLTSEKIEFLLGSDYWGGSLKYTMNPSGPLIADALWSAKRAFKAEQFEARKHALSTLGGSGTDDSRDMLEDLK